jgi:hypothetical protein
LLKQEADMRVKTVVRLTLGALAIGAPLQAGAEDLRGRLGNDDSLRGRLSANVSASQANVSSQFLSLSGRTTQRVIEGRASYRPNAGFGMQANAMMAKDEEAASDGETKALAVGGFAAGENGMLGLYVGAASDQDDTRSNFVGLVGKTYVGPLALTGQLGALETPDLDVSGTFLTAGARYFLTRNLAFDVKAGVSQRAAASQDAQFTNFSVGAEYQIPRTPLSAFVTVGREQSRDLDFTSDSARIGVRLSLDRDLAAREEKGASLDLDLPGIN